ncbi:uncharacterized protein DFL_003956 [Arthrobotrys flagrans]|uniref:Life-span regulatory factor domain-containing protein n=1 Tax=Arthrobotrys flagrans TaxID=97331 RepID=A0A437A3J2_ARTFL|nr:hypothetical protein DFL_003956 [Arthrobotrys flagrans]
MAAAVRRKAIRPPLRKSATVSSSSSRGLPPPTSSAIAAREKKASDRAAEAEIDPLMAASFLPFCSFCEKQIVIPNNGILYCSEACRRRDRDTKSNPNSVPISGSAPLQHHGGFGSWSTPPISPRLGYADIAPPNLIAPSSPTSAHSIPLARTVSNPSGDYGHVSFSPPSDSIPLHRRPAYEMSYPSMSAPPSPTSSSGVFLPSKRPHHLPRNNTFTSAPSLANSPATSTSSHGAYNPYQGNLARPLPPIRNPYSYSHNSSPRSIDLVTPISSITSQPADMASMGPPATIPEQQVYEKQTFYNQGQGQGSLKKLFNFEGMRAPPQPIMRSSPMVSRAASPAPYMTASRSSSPTPGESTKLRSAWTDIY